jgi:hypothetical protein
MVEDVPAGIQKHGVVDELRCLCRPVQSAIACTCVANGQSNAPIQGDVYLCGVLDAYTQEIRLIFCWDQSNWRI